MSSGRAFAAGLATPGNVTAFAPGSKTLPDVSMGSMASSFDEDAMENEQLMKQRGGGGGKPKIPSSPTTPLQRPSSAETTPTTMRRSSSHNEMPRNRPSLGNNKRSNTSQSVNTASDSEADSAAGGSVKAKGYDLGDGPAASTRPSSRRYLMVGNGTNSEDTGEASIEKSLSDGKFGLKLGEGSDGEGSQAGGRKQKGMHAKYATTGHEDLELGRGKNKRMHRHSVASGNESSVLNQSTAQNMGAREYEDMVKATKGENFTLKMELEALQYRFDRLKSNTGERQMAQENAFYLKALKQTQSEKAQQVMLNKEISKEMVRQEEELEALKRGKGMRSDEEYRVLEDRLREEEMARDLAEERAAKLEQELQDARNRTIDEDPEDMQAKLAGLEEQLDDAEHNQQVEREAKERYLDQLEDVKEELEKIRDEKDRLEVALEEKDGNGVDEEEKGRLLTRISELEADKESLEAELQALRLGSKAKDQQRQVDQERLTMLNRQVEDLTLRTTELSRSASRTSTLENEREQVQDKLFQAEQEVARSQHDIAELDAMVQQRDGEIRELERRIHALQEKGYDLADQEARLTDQLQEALSMSESKETDLQNMQADLDGLSEECQALREDLATITTQRDQLLLELQNADKEVDDGDVTRGEMAQDLEDALNDLEQLRESEAQAKDELETHRSAVDDFATKCSDLEARHRQDTETNRKLAQERDELKSTVKRAGIAHAEETRNLRSELQSEVEQYKKIVSDKEQSLVRLAHENEIARERITQKDQDVRDLQSALKSLETDKRRIGDDHFDARKSLELEIDRVKRDLRRSEEELDRASEEVERLDEELKQQRGEVSDLTAGKRDVEMALSGERQERNAVSDKLVAAEKRLKNLEAEIEDLASRSSQKGGTFTPRRGGDNAQKDALALLQAIYVKIAKLCGIEEHGIPSSFMVLKDQLLRRLRTLQSTNAEWERQMRSLEIRLESSVSALGRELDAKKKLLDGVENSVAKMNQTKLAWKAKLVMRDDEIADLKARVKDLQYQLSTLKISTTADTSNETRSLATRAHNAEKRAGTLANQLTSLQDASASQENRYQVASDKWAARVREYEKRLKEAGEMIKVEKQGGKERLLDLENQLRLLANQRDALNAKATKLESILNMAGMQRNDDPDAL